MMTLRSEAFAQHERIPKEHSGEGANVSPPLEWDRGPDETVEYAIICEDPDAPGSDTWVHWLGWGIPPEQTRLEQGDGSYTLGRNSAGEVAYTGPMPPPGHGVHHYRFRVLALGKKLDLQEGATSDKVLASTNGHVLDQGELVGTYERNGEQ